MGQVAQSVGMAHVNPWLLVKCVGVAHITPRLLVKCHMSHVDFWGGPIAGSWRDFVCVSIQIQMPFLVC